MKYLLLPLLLVGCSASAHQTHLQVADAISQGINATTPSIVEEYRVQLRTCRVEAAGNILQYRLCAGEVDEKWLRFRELYHNIRNLQNTYATALEAKDPGIADYVKWMNDAWCQLRAAAPFKMPEVQGVQCDAR